MAFAPDYASSGLFYVYYTDQQGFPTIAQFRRSEGNPDQADPDSRRTTMRVPHHALQPQGRPDPVRPGRAAVRGLRRRRRRRRPRRERPEPRPHPRQDGPHRAAARRRLRDPGRQPVRGPLGRARRGLRLRPAQPVPLLLRPRARAASRSATSARTRSRRSTTCRAAAGRPPRGGYNFGWDVFEGRDRYEGGTAPGHVPPVIAHSQDGGFCSIIGGYVIRDRALGRGWNGRYVYGDYCNARVRLARLRRGSAPSRGTAPARARARLVRRGRTRPRVRGLAERAGVPHRPPLRLDRSGAGRAGLDANTPRATLRRPGTRRGRMYFEGVIPALVTPFDEDDAVDAGALASATPSGCSTTARPGSSARARWARRRA